MKRLTAKLAIMLAIILFLGTLSVSADSGDTLRSFLHFNSVKASATTTRGSIGIADQMATYVTIQNARQANIGTDVTIRGIVTYIDGKNYYIQDDTAGIVVRTNQLNIAVGSRIVVTGKTSEYYDLLQIIAEDVVVDGTATVPKASVVQPDKLTALFESFFVAVKDFRVKSIDKYGNAICTSGDRSFTLLIKKNNDNKVVVGKQYALAEGVLTYNYGAYKIMPSKLVLKNTLPNVDTYEVKVTRIVDGDTIHISPAILGSTKIRMVNMDTPETYHKVYNIADRLQKEYGDVATAQLKSILEIDEMVNITLNPDLPKDQYGRLLAQIYKKDGTNVNLKMVKDGYAVSYFIWPVLDFSDYDNYQAAVYDAKINLRGFWAETDESFELPFVFRARNQGKGLLRYVGNSDTKKYYYPQNYSMIPVEKRIFFKPENQAIEVGYSKDSEQPIPPEEVYQPVSILEARTMPLNSKVSVTGVITYKDGKNYYIQDDSAALVVRSDTLIAEVGDKISVEGGTSEYFDLLQIVTDKIKILDSNIEVVPKHVLATELTETLEGQYVSLADLTVIGADPDDNVDPKNKDATYILQDRTGNKVYIRTKYQTPPKIGQYFAKVEGVLTYSWEKHKIIPSNYIEAPQFVTVKFETNTHCYYDDVKLKSGETLEVPVLPTRPFYVFDAWYSDAACTKKYDFSKPVNKDIILYANWIKLHLLTQHLTDQIDALIEESVAKATPREVFFEKIVQIIDDPKYNYLSFKITKIKRLIDKTQQREKSMRYFFNTLDNILVYGSAFEGDIDFGF